MEKRISVLMGIYNCAGTLPAAIDCILAQTVTDWQLILLTAERDEKKETSILDALKGCGKVTVEPFPELSPYQTTFKFTTFDL